MTETTSQSISSLAITEKRPQRPGSVAGIFFQLFDWNHRLAKKKLFSKKLFPPVGDKRISNKFGSDGKLPMAKLLLIADENRGSFPSMKKTENDSICSLADAEQNNGMRTPGLVARLMGLESMPVVCRDKPKKAPISDFFYNQKRKPVKHVDNIDKTSGFCYDRDLNSEKGPTKVDSRPQKLQKTGFSDRQPVTEFGAEALQFKNVLSRSRRQHHKLASPVKSPRIRSGRNAVRLMEAATKILEPGLQATNVAKRSLIYSNSPRISLEDQAPIGQTPYSLKQTRQPIGPFGVKLLNVQSTCNSCGNFLGAVDFRPNTEEQVTDFASSSSEYTSSELSNASSHGSGKSMKSPKTSLEQEGDADVRNPVIPKSHGAVSLAAQAKANVQKRTQNFMDRKPHSQRESSLRWESMPQLVIDSNALMKNNQKGNKILPAKDWVHERPKLFRHQNRRDSSSDAYNGTKEYISLNRNLGDHATRISTPTRGLDNCKLEIKNDSLSTVKTLVRKRRPVNCSPEVENTGFVSSTVVKQRSVRSDVIRRNESASNAHSLNRSNTNTIFSKKAEVNGAGNSKDADIVSLTFSSPIGHGNGSSSSVEYIKRPSQCEVPCSTYQDEVLLDAKNRNSSPLRVTGLKGDALGALLEQKLRELASLERDESATGDTLSGRSTTSILQELITALTIGRPVSQENGDNFSDGFSLKDSLYNGSPECSDCNNLDEQVCSSSSKLQAKAKAKVSIKFLPLAADCDHPSPTSILDATFSNDSCLSESLNASSGHKLDNRSLSSHGQTQPQLHDLDLLDSATSMNSRMVRIETLNNISSVLGVDTAEIGLTGIKLNYSRDVILNAELLFKNLARYDVDSIGTETLIHPLLLDKLEAFSDHLWGWPKCGLGVLEAKEGNQLRGFLFDCMVESLDSRYSCYFKSGFGQCSKLPLSLSRGGLAREIYEDIRQWGNLAGNNFDDIVEREMSNSIRKWTDFKPEAFDMCVEIESDILHILLDDMVMDLWQCFS